MGSQQLFLVIRARWRFAARVFVGVLILVVLATLMLPKQYVATASVVVQGKTDPLLSNAAYPAAQLLPSDIATQVDIIESHRVAERAVKLLKLDESAEYKESWQRDGRGDLVGWIADQLQRKVTVVPSKGERSSSAFPRSGAIQNSPPPSRTRGPRRTSTRISS